MQLHFEAEKKIQSIQIERDKIQQQIEKGCQELEENMKYYDW